jgi:LytS/YehU family sensor histidine kinase
MAEPEKNVLGGELRACSYAPLTGYFRDGCCATHDTHGVAHLVEGGDIAISATRRGDHLELTVENRCDPERPASRGAGVGLANVRARIEALFGHRARLDVEAAPELYRVRLVVPALPAV